MWATSHGLVGVNINYRLAPLTSLIISPTRRTPVLIQASPAPLLTSGFYELGDTTGDQSLSAPVLDFIRSGANSAGKVSP